MIKMKKNFYKCYSLELKSFLDANMVRWISKGVHPATYKTFYVYEKDDRLSELLHAWSNRPGQESKRKDSK